MNEPAHTPIKRRYLVISAVLILMGVMGAFSSLSIATKNHENKIALENAARYTDAISVFRKLYTSEVVARLNKSGVKITHDYKNQKNAIPLPATLSIKLGERLAKLSSGTKVRLYSEYPFPWRKTKEDKDNFELAALEQFKKNPRLPFFRFETLNNQRYLRYATADIMEAACVECHNNHPDSPKKNWQTGDIRGVLEVSFPSQSISTTGLADMNIIFGLSIILSLFGIFFITMLILRQRQSATMLAAHAEELRHTRDQLEIRVEERTHELKLSEQQISAAKVEVDKANQTKSTFLNAMSHELRTPLNAILGFTQILSLDAAKDPNSKTNKYVDQILSGGKNLETLIDNILLFTEITDHNVKLKSQLLDVRPILTASLQKFEEEASALQIELNQEFSEKDLPMIYVDPNYFAAILGVFLANAIGYNKPGGKVTTDIIETDSGRLRIIISDTGNGIASANHRDVFQPFHRFNMRNSHISGAGVGLSIAKTLANLMQGETGFTSEENVGSVFWVEFPVKNKGS